MKILISTGEVSGDLQGSMLIKSLVKEAKERSIDLEIYALGGERMEAAGAILISKTVAIGAIGFWEAIPFVFPTIKAQAKVHKFLAGNLLDGVILIDYMGPNIRLGNKLKKYSPQVPIAYYIAPQEWAWRLGDGGTTDLINFSDKILAIFEAESDFYSLKGGNVDWVGHPLLDEYKTLPSRKDSLLKLGLKTDQKLLLLFPASRSQELKYIMPTLAEAASIIQKKDPSIYVLVPSGLEGFENPLKVLLERYGVSGRVIPAEQVDSLKPFLFSAGDLALGKSGTINMELALCSVPQIVGYKVSRITAFFARKILKFKVDHISPVNLLLDERLVSEFIQEDFNPKIIAKAAMSLLENNHIRSEMLNGYKRLKCKLGLPGVSRRASKLIFDLFQK